MDKKPTSPAADNNKSPTASPVDIANNGHDPQENTRPPSASAPSPVLTPLEMGTTATIQDNLANAGDLLLSPASQSPDSPPGATIIMPPPFVAKPAAVLPEQPHTQTEATLPAHQDPAQPQRITQKLEAATRDAPKRVTPKLESVQPATQKMAQGKRTQRLAQLKAFFESGEMFGPYQIERELGHGGMGVVYKALDTRLQRVVALKLLLPKIDIADKELRRFLQEAKTTAQLEHDYIVKIFDVGEDPQPYFSMEYIDGQPLKPLIQQGKISPKTIAPLLHKVALAMYTAHEKGIIHRDLKPANIMVDKNGNPKIMDFGLAKQVDVQNSLSKTGDVLGTPAYMPPEQARGQKIDGRSDIYSLGATLYEVLVGRPPFQGDTYWNILGQIMTCEPIMPRKLNPDIPVGLESICLKCLEKNPDKRYCDCIELAHDLKSFQEAKPVIARPVTKIRQARKFIAYNRALAVSVAATLLAIVLGGIFSAIQWMRAENEAQAAQHEMGNTLLQRAKSYAQEKKFFESRMVAARAIGFTEWGGPVTGCPPLLRPDSGEWQEARRLMQTGLQLRPLWRSPVGTHHADVVLCLATTGKGKNQLLASGSGDKTIKLWDLTTGQLRQILTGHTDSVHAVTISPNGKMLASGSLDKTIKLWEIPGGRLLTTIRGHADCVYTVAFSPGGTTLASSGLDKTIKIWDLANGNLLGTLQGHSDAVYTIAFAPDGKTLVSGSNDKTLKLWEVATGKLLATWTGHTDTVYSVAFRADGQEIASGSGDRTICLWEAATGKNLAILAGHRESVYSVAFSPDSRLLISASADKTLKIWDGDHGKLIRTCEGLPERARTVCCSPDGRQVISAGFDNTIRLWEAASGKLLSPLQGHAEAVNCVSFGADGKWLASAGQDKSIKIWDITSGQLVATWQGHTKSVQSLCFSGDGKVLASGSHDKTVKVWYVATGTAIQTLQGHVDAVNDVSISSDGKRLASASSDKTVKLWDIASGALQATLPGHNDAVLSVVFREDGRQLASAGQDKTIKIWDLVSSRLVTTLSGHQSAVNSLTLSPDGKVLVSSGPDKTIRLWDMVGYKPLATLTGHLDTITSVTFSPDGKWLASSSHDKTIRLWDVATVTELAVLQDYFGGVNHVCFSTDGKILASGSSKGHIRLWDVATGIFQAANLTGHTAGVNTIAISPDGIVFATGSDDKTCRLWDLATRQQLAVLPCPSSVLSVAFSPDGNTLASGHIDNDISIWDMDNHNLRTSLLGHQGSVLCVRFHPGGKILASGSYDKTIKLWNINDSIATGSLPGHSFAVNTIAFSPDGKLLASGSMDKTVKLWDWANQKLLFTLDSHAFAVNSATFSPNGKILATSSSDNTIKFWDVASGQELTTLHGHADAVQSVGFSPGGNLLASGSFDTTIMLWDVAGRQEIMTLTGHERPVKGVVFTPDGNVLLSVGLDKSVRIWNMDFYIPYAEYVGAYQFQKLDLTEQPPENLLQPSPRLFFVPPTSHIAILNSRLSEVEKQRRLCSSYLAVGKLDAAYFMFSKSTEGQSDRLTKLLAQRLLSAALVAARDEADDLALRRFVQIENIGAAMASVAAEEIYPALAVYIRQQDFIHVIKLLQNLPYEQRLFGHYLLLLANYRRAQDQKGLYETLRYYNQLSKTDLFGWKIGDYYQGDLTERELFALANREGKDKPSRLCQFYFFTGLDFLVKGNVAKAKEYLENSLRQSKGEEWVRLLARAELRAMNK